MAFARRALSDDLRAAGVFDHAVCDAQLVVSELVSNAIRHAYPLPGEQLKVAWVVDNGWLELAVSDGGSATLPQAGEPTAASVSGRGLVIVANICQTWGVRAEEVGLTVWAILPAPGRSRLDRHIEQSDLSLPLSSAERGGPPFRNEQQFRAPEAVSGLKFTG